MANLVAQFKQYAVYEWVKQRAVSYYHQWNQPVDFDWKSTLVVLIGPLILFPLVALLPMLGYEWPFYIAGNSDSNYPPFLQVVIKPLTIWPWRTGLTYLHGLLLMTVGVATFREAWRRGHGRKSSFGAATLALFSAHIPMLMWEGNAATITMFGILALPFGAPFALIQPHITGWALLARKRWTLFAVGFFILTLLVWGNWPLQVLSNTYGSQKLTHPIAMGWSLLGWPVLVIGLLMLLDVTADPFRLMAIGAFLTPYTLAVHLVLLLPAIGRVRGYRRILLWLSGWTVLLPYAFIAPWAKYLAMLFPLAVWWFLRDSKLPDSSQ